MQLSSSLVEIGAYAFACESLTGALLLPSSLMRINSSAFYGCKFNDGRLVLPERLEDIGDHAFFQCGSFVGGLSIPEKIVRLGGSTFSGTKFNGPLSLNNVIEYGNNDFRNCSFTGELVIPEGVVSIPSYCFADNKFTAVTFPSTIRTVGGFAGCSIMNPLIIPEGVVSIENTAFSGCSYIPAIQLPSTLNFIKQDAFNQCYNISSIICFAQEPPTLSAGAFAGVAKDNFTVEVPSQTVKRYQSEPGWNDFKRIDAHYDFSINRTKMQVLNDSYTKEMVLRVPSGFEWSIREKPEWVTVIPSSGTGKTNVTISVSMMERTNDEFEVNEGSFNRPQYKNYRGRSGEVVFLLNEKEYTSNLVIEQYDSDDADGAVHTLQTHSRGPGIDIVFVGDGYAAPDFANGKFLEDANAGYEHIFDLEPYKTYKEYFNVYTVSALSDERGVQNANTTVDNKFGSSLGEHHLHINSADAVFQWAKKANSSIDFSKSLVILLQNAPLYDGVTYMYTDGSALACCPVSTDEYPYDFRGIIQHEAAGHGFGKLGDEYIYHNYFIHQDCDCDCCEHPNGDADLTTSYGIYKSLGWFKNLSMVSNVEHVPWSHLVFHPDYSDYVDLYEGGYMHSRGVYRSEITSCMNNNVPYFSAISRQAIVERIKYCAGESFSLEEFYANDKADFGPITKGGIVDRTFGVDPNRIRAVDQGPVLMGDHPNVQ